MIPAEEALQKLKAGNARFVSDKFQTSNTPVEQQRSDLVAGQTPFAIILGCSDSRVPAEIIFDQGLGDLFVIRVAGNIVAPSQIGSVEFAAEQFKTRLVVVLGHSNCGAVSATVNQLVLADELRSPNLRAIVDRIKPAVQPILAANPSLPQEQLMANAVKANIMASVNQLRHGSQILENLTESQNLMVVGAEYSLESGKVEFFESD